MYVVSECARACAAQQRAEALTRQLATTTAYHRAEHGRMSRCAEDAVEALAAAEAELQRRVATPSEAQAHELELAAVRGDLRYAQKRCVQLEQTHLAAARHIYISLGARNDCAPSLEQAVNAVPRVLGSYARRDTDLLARFTDALRNAVPFSSLEHAAAAAKQMVTAVAQERREAQAAAEEMVFSDRAVVAHAVKKKLTALRTERDDARAQESTQARRAAKYATALREQHAECERGNEALARFRQVVEQLKHERDDARAAAVHLSRAQGAGGAYANAPDELALAQLAREPRGKEPSVRGVAALAAMLEGGRSAVPSGTAVARSRKVRQWHALCCRADCFSICCSVLPGLPWLRVSLQVSPTYACIVCFGRLCISADCRSVASQTYRCLCRRRGRSHVRQHSRSNTNRPLSRVSSPTSMHRRGKESGTRTRTARTRPQALRAMRMRGRLRALRAVASCTKAPTQRQRPR